MLQLLRPNSSNLPCLYSTFHLEYPLVLSRFYFDLLLRNLTLLSRLHIIGISSLLTISLLYQRKFNIGRHVLFIYPLLLCYHTHYTLNKSSKWYIVYISRVFPKGLNADKSYHYFGFLCIINISNVLCIHFKSSYQYQFTGKTMSSQAKWRLKQKQSRCRKCCASVKLLSEDSFRWLQKCI